MNLLDLVIIYFACGMPFAVYRFALSECGAAETATRSVRAGLLWPLDGGKAVVKRLRTASGVLSKPRIEIIRCQMEELLAQDILNFRRFEFRDVFDRYHGLIGALHSPDSRPVHGLFRIAGAELTPAGEACLGRTLEAKLYRHASSARSELIEYIVASSSPRVFELAATVATELSDLSLGEEISRHRTHTRNIATANVFPLSGSAS
jgi:hypothetical protein